MIKNKIVILLLILSASALSADNGLVKISDSKRSTAGFLVEDGGKKYLYTSQTALFGMHLTGVGYKFNATSFSGHPVKIIGPLMVSGYSDVARAEVATDATDLLKIGKIKDFGEKVTIFPSAITNESDKAEAASISGIGIDTLTLNAKLSDPIPGTPVLNGNKEVVGVLSTWLSILKKGNSKKSKSRKKSTTSGNYAFNIEYSGINRGARLDVNIRWVPAGKVDFIEAGNVINDSSRILEEYMPILDWWFKTPYTRIPDNVSYPNEIKRFVLYNNERTPIIRKLVSEIRKDPIGHEGEMGKVRNGCLHRAKLFLNFPMGQMRQLNVRWKTPFLRNEGSHYAREWDQIIKAIQAKKRGLEFQVPF